LTNKFGKENVKYQQGVAYNPGWGKFNEDSLVNFDEAVKAAADVDYILLCLGENSYTETPGNINDMNLSPNQITLANAMIKTGKRVILILNEGRPRVINEIVPGSKVILDIYLPSNFGADALADILTGDVNPSGKLPITYPRYVNDLVPYIHKPSEGNGNPQGGEFDPQWPFGFGLSYTTFACSDLKMNKNIFGPDETATITVTVKNTGSKEGKEVVQLYTSDLVASLTPDVKRLRRFEKVDLKPGESKTISFTLPLKELAFVNTDNKKNLEAGEFKIEIANLTSNFSVNKTKVF
jgi:beta-glucosidase